jgi:hypothetical protein
LVVDPQVIQVGGNTATITVTVRDESGNPIPGAVVVLEASGQGNLLTQPPATDAAGVATGTISSTAVGPKIISARVGGSVNLNQTAQITVIPAPAGVRLELVEGDAQQVPAGADVPIRPAVRVVNGDGQPLPGVPITFAVTAGGGTVYGGSQTTNSEGIARVTDWTLGTTPGQNTLEVRAESIDTDPVVFHAQGTAGGGVHHFVFRLQPHDVEVDEWFYIEVAMVDEEGKVVPLSGIEIYAGLLHEGYPDAFNHRLKGDRFEETEDGIAVFKLAITEPGRYRFRALSDELPSLGPHGPEPFLFSNWFDVR